MSRRHAAGAYCGLARWRQFYGECAGMVAMKLANSARLANTPIALGCIAKYWQAGGSLSACCDRLSTNGKLPHPFTPHSVRPERGEACPELAEGGNGRFTRKLLCTAASVYSDLSPAIAQKQCLTLTGQVSPCRPSRAAKLHNRASVADKI